MNSLFLSSFNDLKSTDSYNKKIHNFVFIELMNVFQQSLFWLHIQNAFILFLNALYISSNCHLPDFVSPEYQFTATTSKTKSQT